MERLHVIDLGLEHAHLWLHTIRQLSARPQVGRSWLPSDDERDFRIGSDKTNIEVKLPKQLASRPVLP